MCAMVRDECNDGTLKGVEMDKSEPATFGDEFVKTITSWEGAKSQLDNWKEVEATLRREVCNALFDGVTGKVKVNLVDTEKKLQVKAEGKVNVKLDRDAAQTMFDSRLPTSEEAACIDDRPTLKTSGLKDLPNDAELRQAITTTPGMPTLEIKWL